MKEYIKYTISELEETAKLFKTRARDTTDERKKAHYSANAEEALKAIHLIRVSCRTRVSLIAAGLLKANGTKL